jgi:hypothetical protein
MLKKLILAAFILYCKEGYALPGDTLRGIVKSTDKFYVVVQHVTLDSGGNKYENVSPKLKYDGEAGYHWYLLKKNWLAGQKYRLLFKQAPASGVLYIFTVDAMNTPEIYGVLHLDSMRRGGTFPDAKHTLSLNYQGKERLCIWYAKNEITEYEKVILGIEMTRGDFIVRNNGQLGNNLLRPGASWNFTRKAIGFVTRGGIDAAPNEAVLPVIIQFQIN